MPLGDWALQRPAIGSSSEWVGGAAFEVHVAQETWDYLQKLLGERRTSRKLFTWGLARWWNAYAWEYWRFLTPSQQILAQDSAGEGWWKQPGRRADLVGRLARRPRPCGSRHAAAARLLSAGRLSATKPLGRGP